MSKPLHSVLLQLLNYFQPYTAANGFHLFLACVTLITEAFIAHGHFPLYQVLAADIYCL